MNKKLFGFFSKMLLVIVCALFVTGITNQKVYGENRQKLVDDANLLSSSDKEHVEALLMKLSEKNEYDIVIVTKESLYDENGNKKESLDYARDYYWENGYGYGDKQYGIILLVGMEDRDYAFFYNDDDRIVFTNAGLDYLETQVQEGLASEDYAEAFTNFANLCDDYLQKAAKGTPYDNGNMPKKDLTFFHVLVALGIGVALAAAICLWMKSQLNTIHPKNNATDYVVKDSLTITKSSDRFLYFITKKTPKPKSSSSSGHSSSGGRSGHF